LAVNTSALFVEHGPLLDAAERLLRHLRDSQSHLAHGPDVYYWQHGQSAERLESLAMYLTGALVLVRHELYMPAFGLLRSALEHHTQDHLLFLANRYMVTYRNVSYERLREWQEAISEGRKGYEDVLDVRRVGKTAVEVVRSGPHFQDESKGPDAQSISILYGVLEHYDPFTGGKWAQDFIGDWSYRDDSRHRQAKKAADTWRERLTWQALVENLRLNAFYTEKELARWYVHFGFLSAFTHPTPRAVEAIYGHNSPKRYGYDHYASELALLYILTIARLELDAFARMTTREPVVGLAGWDEVTADMAIGEALASHLWFPTGRPHMYDRVQEANHRGLKDGGTIVPRDQRPAPEDLSDEEIQYYSHPLKRIVSQHSHQNELTGFPYFSPWPRSDAWPMRAY
jgi:hypothetical protein